MSDTESQMEAGRRLARDLRAIRRSQSIDVKEVLDATRLADDVIEQLEETALMGNPMFNRVYLRSMFSSYASVLGIKTSDMMTALEEALAGSYIGSLAKLHLGDGEKVDHLDASQEKSGKSAGIGSDTKEEKDGERAENEEEAPPKANDIQDESDSEIGSQDSDSANAESATSTNAGPTKGKPKKPAGQKKSEKTESFKPTSDKSNPENSKPQQIVVEADPISLDPIKGKTTPSKTVLLPNMSGFLILVVAGIALISLIWFAVSWMLSPKIDPEEAVVVVDSSTVLNQVMPERVVLGDTIRVDLIAYVEALDPIRVKEDRDLRRPYWIEHTDRMIFEMQDVIEFEREVDHARILLDGYEIPVSWYASSVRAVITREKAQTWLDSLTTAGTSPPRAVLPE